MKLSVELLWRMAVPLLLLGFFPAVVVLGTAIERGWFRAVWHRVQQAVAAVADRMGWVRGW